eukprot:gb/GECG01007160.1/.p1 GENE.gb/GECG01007160.1/~~gb/GECG01007160.1/.p1  ORF type:complete len:656 (+),score=52.00 gb/GECG01007160.1/:1-1968(+)
MERHIYHTRSTHRASSTVRYYGKEEEEDDDSDGDTSDTSTGSCGRKEEEGWSRRIRCTRRALGVHRRIMDDLRDCVPATEDCSDGKGDHDKTDAVQREKAVKRRISSALSSLTSADTTSNTYAALKGMSFDAFLSRFGLEEEGENPSTASSTAGGAHCNQFNCLASQIGHKICAGTHSPAVCLRRLALATISCNTSHFLELIRSSVNRTKAKHRRCDTLLVDLDRYLQDMSDVDAAGDEATLQAIVDVTGSSIGIVELNSNGLSVRVDNFRPRELPQVPAPIRRLTKAANCRGKHFWLTVRRPYSYRNLQISASVRDYQCKRPINRSPKLQEISMVSKYERPATRATNRALPSETSTALGSHVSLYDLFQDFRYRLSKPSPRKAAMNAAKRICDFLQLENPRRTCTIEVAKPADAESCKRDTLLRLASSIRSDAEEQSRRKRRRNCSDALDTNDSLNEEPLECIICTEQVAYDQYGILNGCRHCYHYHCILKWSKISNKCPICKGTFSLIQRTSSVAGRVKVLDQTVVTPPPSLIENYIAVEWIRTVDGNLVPAYNGYTREELEATCYVCNQGGEPCMLLLCDGRCGRGAHFPCVGLERIPEGEWYCERCVHFLEARGGQGSSEPEYRSAASSSPPCSQQECRRQRCSLLSLSSR